ncbi:MAG TPA: hypothetical protein VFF27_02320 [Bacteroidia bacterium]|jgi:hypothetical protein|nr:hypothetical protein [Bacteroidia bacterium]
MKKAFLKSVAALCLIVGLLTVSSCHKEGLGGNASISGTVYHHEAAIPNAVVYIKFNTTDFPGDTPESYDASTTVDGNGKYIFQKVYKGDYYIYGIGFDKNIQEIVKGGVGIKVKKNKVYSQDVPVTED